MTLQRGWARLLPISGRTDEALAAYQALTRRAPTPGYRSVTSVAGRQHCVDHIGRPVKTDDDGVRAGDSGK